MQSRLKNPKNVSLLLECYIKNFLVYVLEISCCLNVQMPRFIHSSAWRISHIEHDLKGKEWADKTEGKGH